MTKLEFNTKYNQYLEEGYYGLTINNPKVISFLDNIFQDFIKIPNFKYFQIKFKFNEVVVYSNLSFRLNSMITKEIENILYYE